MICLYCKKEHASIMNFSLSLVNHDDATVNPFCDWTCLAGYVKERGLLTRDDFPATDRC